MTFQEILALLVAQFQGVRKDGLTQLARTIALTANTKEDAEAAVGKLTADGAKQFVADWRKDADAEITKANDTYKDGLQKKYDFVEKKTDDGNPTPPPAGGVMTPEAIQAMITKAAQDATAPLLTEIATLKGGAVTAARKGALEGLLTDEVPEGYRTAIMEGFGTKTFTDENEFNAYLEAKKTEVAAFTQQWADRGLSAHGAPSFGAVNKEGVSAGVTSYIETKAAEASGTAGLGGKEV